MTVWQPGQVPVRPGPYIRVTNFGEAPLAGTALGIVGAVLRATSGPPNVAQPITSLTQVDDLYGTGVGTDAIREALRGGATSVVAVRVGSGGAAATRTLVDTTGSPINVVTLAAKYAGTRGNALRATIRDSLTDASRRELLVYELISGVLTLRETISFKKRGSAPADPTAVEPTELVAALAASQWVAGTFIAAGNNTLATITQQALTSGSEPAVLAADYTAALAKLELEEWDVATLDTNDTTIQASTVAWLGGLRNQGKRRMLVIGEPTSVSLSTRQTNARALNDPAVLYVGNGWVGTDGLTREGWSAAARVAGMLSGTPINQAITNLVVSGAATIVGAMTTSEIEQSLNSGVILFSTSARRQIKVEQGITTFISPTATLDAGWKKARRVKTRDALLNRIAATWDPLVGQINNDADGRSSLIGLAQAIVDEMIRDDALLQGTVYTDPGRPPAGDTAYFVAEVYDNDSAEKLLLTAGFAFGQPPAA